MGLVRRINAGIEQRQGTLSEPPDWLWDALGGQASYTGRAITQKNALGLDAVWAAVLLLVRSVAQCPLIVYQGAPGVGVRERATDAWQWELFHERPNGEQAPDQFFSNIVGHLNLWGNFYAEKVLAQVNGRTVVKELWPLSPANITVERDKAAPYGKLFRVAGEARPYTPEQVLHIPSFGYDGLRGLSPIAIHREGLAIEAARAEWRGRFYANNAHPAGVIQVAGSLSDEAALRVKASWEAAHRGLQNSSRVAVLEEGATWQSIGMPLEDQQYIEQERFGVNKVARIFGLPPEKIGGERTGHSMTYQNIESANLDFVVSSVMHWLIRIEQALRFDQHLFPQGVPVYPEFLAEGLLRGDSSARAAFYEKMFGLVDEQGKRVLSVDEIRERENMGPASGTAAVPADTPPTA